MRNGIRAAAVTLLALSAAPAWAETTQGGSVAISDACALRMERDGGVIIITAGAWEAECREGGGCAIRGPEVAGARLQMSQPLEEKHWRLVVTLPEPADAAEGVALTVDGGEPMRVPYEFLEVRAGGRALAIRPEVADIVLGALRRGRRLEWRYTRGDGVAKRTAFDISCLGAEGLLAATEKRLATMRAMKQFRK